MMTVQRNIDGWYLSNWISGSPFWTKDKERAMLFPIIFPSKIMERLTFYYKYEGRLGYKFRIA